MPAQAEKIETAPAPSQRSNYIIGGVALLLGTVCGLAILPLLDVEFPTLRGRPPVLVPVAIADSIPAAENCLYLVSQYRGRARIQIRLTSGSAEERVAFENDLLLNRLRVTLVHRDRISLQDATTNKQWTLREGQALVLKEQ